ncbi:MAG: methyltransferase domain-containing protein [Chloroflexi bacterium]|nr:methyltransferase domain-containing protein [Chloroflexota bacterium]
MRPRPAEVEETTVTALENWQQRVLSCRDRRGEPEEALWQRTAAWYDQWVANNDYVEVVLPRLAAYLAPDARVLEIGPGTGAFTVPLARQVREVVAVEPSHNMCSALRHNLARAGMGNVCLIPQRIEEVLDQLPGPFQLAMAAHSLYNVLAVDAVVARLAQMAEHTVILIGTGDRTARQQALRRFASRPPASPAHFGDLYPVLLEMGLYADAEILQTSANYIFDSEEALTDWWARHLHVDSDARAKLHVALLAQAERQGSQVALCDRVRTALITIHQGRSLFRRPADAPANDRP